MSNRLIVLTTAVLMGLTGRTLPQSPEPDAARTWFLQVQQQAYEAVMPLVMPDILVAYRSSHEMRPGSLEQYFVIQYVRFGGGFNANLLKATVLIPVGDSIQTQLINLRTENRGASLKDLLSRLEVRKETVYVSSCEAIRKQTDGLSQVRLSIPKRDIVTFDAREHQFALELPNLKMTATIEGDNAPLVRWAIRTHELLLGCLPVR